MTMRRIDNIGKNCPKHALQYLGFAAKSFSWGQGVGKLSHHPITPKPYHLISCRPTTDDRRP